MEPQVEGKDVKPVSVSETILSETASTTSSSADIPYIVAEPQKQASLNYITTSEEEGSAMKHNRPRISISTSTLKKKLGQVTKHFTQKKPPQQSVSTEAGALSGKEVKLSSPVPPIPTFLTLLPHDICKRILSLLSYKDLARVSETCLSWYDLGNDAEIWSQFCKAKGWFPRSIYAHFVDWKRVFAVNLKLEKNWNEGNYKFETLTRCEDVSSQKEQAGSPRSSATELFGPLPESLLVPPHQGPVHAICLEGETLVSAGTDGFIEVWMLEIEEGSSFSRFRHRFSIRTPDYPPIAISVPSNIPIPIFAVCFTEGSIVTGLANGGLIFYNRFTSEQQLLLKHEHRDGISALVKFRDKVENWHGTYLVTASFDGSCRIYAVQHGVRESEIASNVVFSAKNQLKLVFKGAFEAGDGLYTLTTFKKDGTRYFVCGGTSGELIVWSVNLRCVQRVKAHSDTISTIETDGSSLLFSGSMDRTICVWSTDTFERLRVIEQDAWIKSVRVYQPTSQLKILISLAFDDHIHVWNINDIGNPVLLMKLSSADWTYHMSFVFADLINPSPSKSQSTAMSVFADNSFLLFGDSDGHIFELNFADFH